MDNVIQIFGKKVKIVKRDSDSCVGCALSDVCNRIMSNDDGILPDICDSSDGTLQMFVNAD